MRVQYTQPAQWRGFSDSLEEAIIVPDWLSREFEYRIGKS